MVNRVYIIKPQGTIIICLMFMQSTFSCKVYDNKQSWLTFQFDSKFEVLLNLGLYFEFRMSFFVWGSKCVFNIVTSMSQPIEVDYGNRCQLEILGLVRQGWAIPGFGQEYYTLYYTGQKNAKLYNILYQYYAKSNWLILVLNNNTQLFFNQILKYRNICLFCDYWEVILVTIK